MKCLELTPLLNDLIDAKLDRETTSRCEQHLRECASCQSRRQEQTRLRSSLKKMPVPEMRREFFESVVSKAVKVNEFENNSSSKSTFKYAFSAGFSFAAAAGVLIWMAFNTFLYDSAVPKSDLGMNIALHESRDIKLVFNSAQELRNARVSLNVPKQIAIKGYIGLRQLSWKANLTQGKNILSLPVEALNLGNGELITKVEHGGKSKELRLKIRVEHLNQTLPQDNEIELLNQTARAV